MNKSMEIPENKNIYYFNSIDSTNQAVRRLAEQDAAHFSIVIAEEQLAGRGRLGRSWFSPPYSGLWFSILLRPKLLTPPNAAQITLVTAVVIASYLRDHHGLEVKIKWPNDLLLENKKVGGILTELKGKPDHIEYLIVGIGLNINQQQSDFPTNLGLQAASLSTISGQLYDRTELFLSLRDDLIKGYGLFFSNGFNPFYHLWKKYTITLGKKVTITWPGGTLAGEALDLTEEGALLVKDSLGNTKIINYGEIK